MYISVHAGHNPDGKIACGAVGLLKESTAARTVANEVVRLLTEKGHTVWNDTCDNGVNQQDVLNKIIQKCNSHHRPDGKPVDLVVSLHLNSAANDPNGDGRTTGTETYIFSLNGGANEYAQRVTKEIAALGFKNRGVKVRSDLRVLRETLAAAMLIECCFVDDADDAKLFDPYKMARAIVQGILNEKIVNPAPVEKDSKLHRVQVGAFSNPANAERLKAELIGKGYSAFITQ